MRKLFSTVSATVLCIALSAHAESNDMKNPLAPQVTSNIGMVAATDYGADSTGAVDATLALNTCLINAGRNGVCVANGKFKVLGDVTIPANTALWCGYSYPDLADYNSGYQNEHGIMLDSGHTIRASGGGATVKSCLIYRNGMVFPPADSSAFAGVALSDNGNTSFSIVDSEIIGFNTGVYFTGIRPYMNRVLIDASGIGTAAVEVDTGNTDSGYIRDVRVNPLNGVGTCASLRRPGVGLRMGGRGGPGAYLDGVVVQGYATYQFDFEGGGETIVGQIWADNPLGTCGQAALTPSVGVMIGPGASINANQVYIGAQWAGMLILSNGAESTMNLLSISYATVGIELGDPTHSGNLNPLNAFFQSISNSAIYVFHENVGYHSVRTVMANVNSHAAPYIQSAPGFNTSIGLGPFGQFSVESFQTDLGSVNPFQVGPFVAGPGSTNTLAGIVFPDSETAIRAIMDAGPHPKESDKPTEGKR